MAKFKKEKEKQSILPKVSLPKLNIKMPRQLQALKWIDPFTYVDLFVMPKVKKVSQSETIETIVNIIFAFAFAAAAYFILGLLFGTTSPLVIVYSASMEPTFYRGDVMALSGINSNTYLGPEVILNQNLKNTPVSSFVEVKYDAEGRLVSLIIEGQEISYKKDASVIVYSAYHPTVPSRNNLPIIHRAIVKLVAPDGNFILTKGDNDNTKSCTNPYFGNSIYCNPTFDQDCGTVDPLRETASKECLTLYPVAVDKIQGVSFFQLPKIGCVKLWLFDDLLSLITRGKLPADFRWVC